MRIARRYGKKVKFCVSIPSLVFAFKVVVLDRPNPLGLSFLEDGRWVTNAFVKSLIGNKLPLL